MSEEPPYDFSQMLDRISWLEGQLADARREVERLKDALDNCNGALAEATDEIARFQMLCGGLGLDLCKSEAILDETIQANRKEAAAQARGKALEWAERVVSTATGLRCDCGGHSWTDPKACIACRIYGDWHTEYNAQLRALKQKEDV